MCQEQETWKSYIENFIDSQCNELECKILELNTDNKGLCCLRNVNFYSGELPDYSDRAQSSLYLLRYGPAYMVEYRAAYEEILRGKHIARGDLQILSVGCGAFIDKASAYYAMQKHDDFKNKDLIYKGVDIESWGIDVFPRCEHTFIHSGIENVLLDKFGHCIDVIIFPKSISEISDDALNKFVENISGKNFENKACIITSNRRSVSDCQKSYDFVYNFLQKTNYILKKTIVIDQSYRKSLHATTDIQSVFERFCFCKQAIYLSCNIYAQCRYKDDNECDDQCYTIIDRSPVEKTDLFNTTVYCVEKK